MKRVNFRLRPPNDGENMAARSSEMMADTSFNEYVASRFEDEKMSLIATAHATDEELRALGLSKRGDLIRLLRFCVEKVQESENKEKLNEKKDLLEKILEKNKSKRRFETFSSLPHNRSRRKAPEGSGTKKVQLGWLHYSDRRKRYVAVRQIKGGDTRDTSLSIDATADSIIEAGKELFFPGGISSFGSIDMMEFTLANYKEDTISNVVVRGSVLPFTLQRYLNATKLPRARLYLASKQKQCESEEDGDHSLLQPMLDLTNIRRHHPEEDTTFPESPMVDQDQASDEGKDVILLSSVTSLKANRDLVAEQDKDYQYSLLADQKKEEERREKLLSEIGYAEQQEQLRQARLHRVPDVPKGGSIVLIQVRHVTLGVIKRNFSSNDKMWSVYDWVGSLSLLPPYFELSDFRGQVLRPEQSVMEGEKSTLNMSASECTPSLDDEEIDFKGFGTTEVNNEDTLALLDLLPPVSSAPLVEQVQDLIP
ncbi:hypothetical protein AWC38_SpisGene17223 [Stylophora pistillata]|uniref:SAM domain-containing protein n=1 Tax=Stylophora pistillata TaxID=50429 RepID=A0A2B4RNM9_STYPI|nr:hypothetical protein AWC38_SpisGene17223 [Stylophora pistillata]